MVKKIKNIIIAIILTVILVPINTKAYLGNNSAGGNSSTRSCPGPFCYGTANYSAYVTLYKYDVATNEVEIKCGYNVPDNWSKMPEIMGSRFAKWIEKDEPGTKSGENGILSDRKDYGIFSADGTGEAEKIANFFNSGKVGNCTAGTMPTPPNDPTSPTYVAERDNFIAEVKKYYISVEPGVDLHEAGGNPKVRKVRFQCSKSRTNKMGTFQNFLRSLFNSQTEAAKNNCHTGGGKCIGETIATAMVGTQNSVSPFWMVDTSKIKSYTCAGSGKNVSNSQYGIKSTSNDLPKGLKLKPSPTNKYELTGEIDHKKYYVSRNAVGIAFYWVYEIGDSSTEDNCEESCQHVKGNDDEYLQCAANYCDEENYDPSDPDAKQLCIIESCKYNPLPMTCLTTKENDDGTTSPTNENDPYKDVAAESNINKATTCGTISGSYKECHTNSTLEPVIANRKYYSISCIGKTAFDFKDTSRSWLVPGELLEYNVELDGNKMCKVYFDYVSWKIDYASIHSKDPNQAEKKAAMKKHIENFNKAFVPDLSGGSVGIIEQFKSILGFEEYDITKVNIQSKYAEIINNENKDSADYKLVSNGPTSSNSDTITSSGTVSIPVIEVGSRSYLSVNTYTTSSDRAGYYQMPGQCVKEDGSGNVYTATGERCNDTTKPKSGYYTSLQATPTNRLTPGRNHEVVTIVTATTNGESDYYISNTDKCKYNIKENENNKGRCTLSVKESDGCSNSAYNTDVTVELTTSNIPLNDIVAKEIRINDSSFHPSLMEDEKLITNTNSSCSNSKNTAYGKVETKDGSTIQCTLPIEFKGSCSCKLERASGTDNIYELTNVNMSSPTRFYYKINGGEEIEIKPDLLNGKYLIKTEGVSQPFKIEGIIRNATDSVTCQIANSCESCTVKYKPSDTASIEAYCKTNWMTDQAGYQDYDSCVKKCSTSACRQTYDANDSESIYNYCKTSWKDDPAGYESPEECRSDCSVKKCTTIFKAEEVMEIKNYCKKYWNQDKARYQSYDDCVTGCTFTCNKITTTTYEGIITECNQHYSSWGFKSADNCSTTCCVKLGTCNGGTDYVYRPINPKNPFPDSYLDNKALSSDKQRRIGANWFGKDKYITSDLEDSTRGIDAEIGNPEYEIILDGALIKKIRQDNKLYNSTKAKSGGNVYIDYIPYVDSSNSQNKVRYESKFIRDSDSNSGGGGFYDYFTYIEGNAKAGLIKY